MERRSRNTLIIIIIIEWQKSAFFPGDFLQI